MIVLSFDVSTLFENSTSVDGRSLYILLRFKCTEDKMLFYLDSLIHSNTIIN